MADGEQRVAVEHAGDTSPAFTGGAVLASVIDTLAPEAFGQSGPLIALASAEGFVTGYTLSL